MENEFRFLEFEGIQIAAFIEGHQLDEHTEYNFQNILFYVERGQLNIREGDKLHTITKGNFCLVRKFSTLTYFKTWDEDEEYAVVNALMLLDNFIHEAIEELGLVKPKTPVKEAVVNLQNNSILKGLYYSLTAYIADNEELDEHLMYLKTKEAIFGIIKSDPKYMVIFYEFSKTVKADLRELMHHNIFTGLPLESLAKLSGRSLSTFNRDFKKLFKTSPYRWLMKQRLQKAHNILQTTNKKSSEIYLELGFKDLAHFSKAFKKEFNISPSELVKESK